MKDIKLPLVSTNKVFWNSFFEEAAFLSGRKRIVNLLTESSCFLFCVGCFLVSEICSLGRKEAIIFSRFFVCLFCFLELQNLSVFFFPF